MQVQTAELLSLWADFFFFITVVDMSKISNDIVGQEEKNRAMLLQIVFTLSVTGYCLYFK